MYTGVPAIAPPPVTVSSAVLRRPCGSRLDRAPRDAEVEDLHAAVLAHHHVLGLDVAMDDARLVRGLERARDVDEPADLDAERGSSALSDEARSVEPDDVLHREVEPAVRLADVEDRDHVRVAERRDGAGLAEEPRRELAATSRRGVASPCRWRG